MRSFVTFAIEHGETTDPFTQFIEEAHRQGSEIPDCEVIDYTVKVNVGNPTVDEIVELLRPDPWGQGVMCGHCDSETHESRDCPAVVVIQRSERYAESQNPD